MLQTIGEHHVSVAIWGKPGDVREPVVVRRNTWNLDGVFSRVNTDKELFDDGAIFHCFPPVVHCFSLFFTVFYCIFHIFSLFFINR